ncbi:MAG: SRPBCC family protein [Acidobacteriota bacterium]
MKTFEFSQTQWLNRPLSELFPFFAEARNLGRITPPWLRFEVISQGPISMEAGVLIDYRIHWRGLPMRWRSEISVWDPPFRFVDRQVRGPYRLWHHEHRFTERDGGTEVSDQVHYAVWGGSLIERLFVRRDVAAIFDYRRQRLEELFPPSI